MNSNSINRLKSTDKTSPAKSKDSNLRVFPRTFSVAYEARDPNKLIKDEEVAQTFCYLIGAVQLYGGILLALSKASGISPKDVGALDAYQVEKKLVASASKFEKKRVEEASKWNS